MEVSRRYQNIAIDKLIPYVNNARTHSDEQIKKIQASLREFGFVNPVLIDKDFGIIAGHGRVQAAQREGYTEVPCLLVDHLTEAQKKAYIIADNRLALDAGWDMEILKIEIEGLKEFDFDVSLTGFDAKEIDLMFEEPQEIGEDDFDVDAALGEIVEPTTKRGDVWQLGRHRLMCGDATILSDTEKLMGGLQANMIFTDPPYNVDYEGGTKDKLKIKNDKMGDSAFYKFLYDSFVNMITVVAPGGAIYVCHADSEGLNFRKALVDSGWLLKQCIIWVKNAFIMGMQDHHWQHEPILYGWKPGAAHSWYGGRRQSTVIKDEDGIFVNKKDDGYQLTFNNGNKKVVLDVPGYDIVAAYADDIASTWHISRPLRNGEHPTMKPILLCARAITNSSQHNGIVLDLFGGSGSTLIACEQLNRICYMMELDEKYCDVIIRRWEEYTGDKAVLVAD